MALSTKLIKTRLRSIGNTKKITRAMEMVSAAKMRRTVTAVTQTRPYAQTAIELVQSLSLSSDQYHPLLIERSEIKKIAVVLITANRGLAGSFNANIINEATRSLSAYQSDQIDWIALGKKGVEHLARTQQQIIAQFPKADVAVNADSLAPVVRLVISDFVSGVYDKVFVVYTDYVSALTQKPKVLQLLPLQIATEKSAAVPAEYIFEPSVATVLDQILPRLVEIELYQALLESNASEHSARMVAMKNAAEAASDMISDLTLAFNQARQAAITSEIAEIAGGKAALGA